MFPSSFNAALTNNQHVIDARTRLDTSMAAYKQTMTVQAQVVENIAADQAALNGIVQRSQGAEGALQAQQATNQLLALVAKQQFQIQTLMAAQYRADAINQASRVQSQTDAQDATTKFLGSGNAYRSEEHTSELQSLMRISYAVFCLKKKKTKENYTRKAKLTTKNSNSRI